MRTFKKGQKVKWNKGFDSGVICNGVIETWSPKNTKSGKVEHKILVNPEHNWTRYVTVEDIL